jgi:hypothetical protein
MVMLVAASFYTVALLAAHVGVYAWWPVRFPPHEMCGCLIYPWAKSPIRLHGEDARWPPRGQDTPAR